MADDPDIRISLSLDPESIRLTDGYNDETAQFVGSVVSAYTDAYDVLGKLHTARKLWESNQAVTKENAVIIVAKEAEKHRARVLKRFDLAARDLQANITHAESQLKEPLAERAGLGSLNTEVRSYVRGLDRKEREAFMREAMERDDLPTLEAVLGGQFFLSGMTNLDHDHHLRKFHERKRPDLVRRLDLMNRFKARLEGVGPILNAQFTRAIGAHPNVAAQLQDANDRALAALKIEPTA